MSPTQREKLLLALNHLNFVAGQVSINGPIIEAIDLINDALNEDNANVKSE